MTSKPYLSLSKSVCKTCGTINSIDGEGSYSFSRNVYGLNSCDHNFFLDFDNTTYEPYNSTKHTTTLKRGKYCQFCKGTQARATESLENHHFTETIDGQLGNNRFYVSEHCDDCGYETSEYITAKSVVSSYYGTADESALVTLNENNSFTVLLPAENLIDYANRITVTILDKDGGTVKDMNVTVKDVAENEKSGVTDESGKMTVPPLSEDYTDSEGKAKVNGMNILVADEAQRLKTLLSRLQMTAKSMLYFPNQTRLILQTVSA